MCFGHNNKKKKQRVCTVKNNIQSHVHHEKKKEFELDKALARTQTNYLKERVQRDVDLILRDTDIHYQKRFWAK